MTPEAVVRRLFELIDEDDADEIFTLLDPEVVWLGTRGGLDEGQVFRGAEAFLAYREEIQRTWEQLTVEIERVFASDETVVAFLHETARGRAAVEVESETAAVFKVRGGRIVEGRGYLDRDEALRAAELDNERL
jgi:ketosteroid isomerase-like protein